MPRSQSKRRTSNYKPATTRPPKLVTAPAHVLAACRQIVQAGALTVVYVRGGAVVSTDYPSELELEPDLWVLARFPAQGEALDGHVAVYAAPQPPTEYSGGQQAEGQVQS